MLLCDHVTHTHTQVGRPGDGIHDKYTIIVGSGYMDEKKKEPSRGAVFCYTSDDPISGTHTHTHTCTWYKTVHA